MYVHCITVVVYLVGAKIAIKNRFEMLNETEQISNDFYMIRIILNFLSVFRKRNEWTMHKSREISMGVPTKIIKINTETNKKQYDRYTGQLFSEPKTRQTGFTTIMINGRFPFPVEIITTKLNWCQIKRYRFETSNKACDFDWNLPDVGWLTWFGIF